MKKPIKNHDVYDLHEILNYIAKKHKLHVYDFYDSKPHFNNWCNQHGLEKKDLEGKSRSASNIWYKQYVEASDGQATCPEFEDFWKYFFQHTQPEGEENFYFIATQREKEWPEIMNQIMAYINKEFGDSFDSYLSES